MIHAKEIGFQSPGMGIDAGGEIYEGGTSVQTITGEWRVNRPVFHPESASSACCVRRSVRTVPSQLWMVRVWNLTMTIARAVVFAIKSVPSMRSPL